MFSATEAILFMYLCSCLQSIFAIQEGHLQTAAVLPRLFITVYIHFVERTWHTVGAQYCLFSEWQDKYSINIKCPVNIPTHASFSIPFHLFLDFLDIVTHTVNYS